MFLRQLELTTALRPYIDDDGGEALLFIANGVGLYDGKFKLPNYQKGHLYLTSHRVCYVDDEEPRKYSVAVDLKEIERTEFYAGFLKSSAKITLFPKPSKRNLQGIRSPIPQYAYPSDALVDASATSSRSLGRSPAPARNLNATWACGIKPSLALMIKAAVSAMSTRPAASTNTSSQRNSTVSSDLDSCDTQSSALASRQTVVACPRCTFQNDASLPNCEICGASLQNSYASQLVQRPESPGPTLSGSIIGNDTIETIKFSFRAGGEKTFLERLKGALVQRKWLLQSAPPVPKPARSATLSNGSPWQVPDTTRTDTPYQRVVGIAGLERRGAELRENNKAVIGTAFEDLEALMTSAKEVIAMAEQFSRQTNSGTNSESSEAKALLSDSASALGLVATKDMLGTGSASETLYSTELARNLAEFLTDDRRGILRKEGGIMSLVDLWAVFNRTRNGIELISPLDFEKAATMWESLQLPIRLRRFRSGLLVVQEKSRTDDKTIASLLNWLREPQYAFPPSKDDLRSQSFGRGVTAQETAERFGWSVGVATEELEMAEENSALCRDQCLDGIRFWENHFMHAFDELTEPRAQLDAVQMMDELRF
ncbi:Vacuolar protein-sorting-associated protein 36 [Vermiconidia calcicola]|uniref:Vacuolar protein-sorting-associated protein 36 n=1 Tax=Vermiconidia calcicola TaxID=1690605 RepID=A0ACC3N313_9PEZI|nr:Vacuolar protein-sorting-associated protein 36 [Vermiconidia calcicola]